MAKSWIRRHLLAYILIVSPILGFVSYLITHDFFSSLTGTVLGGLLAYKLLLPLLYKFTDFMDSTLADSKKTGSGYES
jgi:hypothetical protein